VGVQTESSIDNSALHQLLVPILRVVHDCPDEWRESLEQTFGTPGTAPVGAFALANAILGVLDLVAAPSGVLLVIDDVQWIDSASATMLAFVTRRINNPAVSIVIALRSGFDSPLAEAGLPELQVLPLSAAASADLLERASGALDAALRLQLLSESAGNPLALIELPKTLTSEQRRGDESLAPSRTISGRLESVFAARLDELSENARWLLLMCSLDRTGQVATIKRASGEDWWFADLVAANDIGLLELDGDQVSFRHPLARSAVVQAFSREEQRQAHSRLAEALRGTGDTWVWHRAAASNGTDPEVADALAEISRRAFASGDSRGALRAILTSIEATPPGDLHDRRAARAAFFANVGGQPEVARRILPIERRQQTTEPRDGVLDETDGYIAATRAFWLTTQEVDMHSAFLVITRALQGTRNITDPWVLELFDLLVLLCLRSGRVDYWSHLNRLLAELGATAPQALLMTRDALGDPARTAHGFAQRLAAFRSEVLEMEPWQLMWMAACSAYVDDLPAWRGEIRRVIQDEELGGSLAAFLTALVLTSLDGLTAGDWSAAQMHGERGLVVAERLGFAANVGDFRSVLATLAARQGDYSGASSHIAAIQEWALPRGFHDHRAWALFAQAQIEMAQQNYDDAYGLLIEISPAGSLDAYQPVALMAFLDTVAAAWKSGRHDEARQHVRAGHAARLGSISPRLAFHLASSDAIVSDDLTKRALFESALDHGGIPQWPFDEARIRLHFGAWLRAEGNAAAARPHLRSASRIFDRLGAYPWRERAEEELVKAADPGARVLSGVFSLLTPQETRIAILASEGRSNNDIAERLFLSPRTVASHLYKIFPKVGVTSRAGLHQKLNPGEGGS
jgi:DNA-binding CsgD family transcriptional regulator